LTTTFDVIGKRVDLMPVGKTHVGLCPFHREKTPSLSVFGDAYHCFGCGAHGDAVSFVMQFERLRYPEAVARVAEELGGIAA
jgi:DNA primase